MDGSPPFTLGTQITAVVSLSDSSILVAFESAYEDLYLYQLYVGRTLVGVTDGPLDRQVAGQWWPALYPEEIQILAIDPSDRNTDYGSDLPDRPYNRVKITYSTAGMAADTETIEISSGTEPGGAVDEENLIARDFYRGSGTFSQVTEPLGPGGEWNFEVAGRDGTIPDGNRGTALELSATITAHPPDLVADPDGERFIVTADTGTLTLSYTLPEFA